MPRRKRQPTAISYAVEPGSRWWAYARHSPGPEQSIASQRRAIAEAAAAAGATVVRWFVDEAESGASLDRDQFAEMVEAAGILAPHPPPAPVAGILVLNFARFGRDQQLVQFFLAGFRLNGWRVVPLQERESIPEGEFASIFEALTHWKDQQRLQEITRETKRGLRQVVSQAVTLPDGRVVTGFSGGGFPPIGYRAEKVQTGVRKNGEPRFNSYWVADETPDAYGETPWTRVCRAWTMMATGRATYPQIDAACHLFGALNSYNDLFRRRTYLGERVCGDLVVPDAHPAAVTAEDFAAVQRILDGRLRPQVHPEQVAPAHLLAGLVVCGYCGATLVLDGERGRYVCRTLRSQGRAACPHSMRTPARLVEDVVLRVLTTRLLAPERLARLADAVQAGAWAEGQAAREALERAERQVTRLEEAVEQLLDALEARASVPVRRRLAAREAELEAARADVASLRRRLADTRPTPRRRAALAAELADLRGVLEAGTPSERRAVLADLVVRVRVYADQVEVVHRLGGVPGDTTPEGFGRGTPSGAIAPVPNLEPGRLCAPLVRGHRVHFRRDSQRQVRERIVNRRGEVKLFGKQVYVSSALAGQRVLVRVGDGLATIYAGETVVRKRLPCAE